MLLSDYIVSKKIVSLGQALKLIEGRKIIILDKPGSRHNYSRNTEFRFPSESELRTKGGIYLRQNRGQEATGINFEYVNDLFPLLPGVGGRNGGYINSDDILLITKTTKDELNAKIIASKLHLDRIKDETEKEIKRLENVIKLMDSLKVKEYDEGFNNELANLELIKDSFKDNKEYLKAVRKLHDKYVEKTYSVVGEVVNTKVQYDDTESIMETAG